MKKALRIFFCLEPSDRSWVYGDEISLRHLLTNRPPKNIAPAFFHFYRNTLLRLNAPGSILIVGATMLLCYWTFLFVTASTNPAFEFWFVVVLLTLSIAAILFEFLIVLPRVLSATTAYRNDLRACDGRMCWDCGYRLAGLLEDKHCPECGCAFTVTDNKVLWGKCFPGLWDDIGPV